MIATGMDQMREGYAYEVSRLKDEVERLRRELVEAREECRRNLCYEIDQHSATRKARDEARRDLAGAREALDELTLVIGLTPIAGNKEALQEAVDRARKLLAAAPAEPGDGDTA